MMFRRIIARNILIIQKLLRKLFQGLLKKS